MSAYTRGFDEIDRTHLALVGGKGANLGELCRVRGLRVPDGFCVTTEAYRATIEADGDLTRLVEDLMRLEPGELEAIRTASESIRAAIQALPISAVIAAEIAERLRGLGESDAYAVRSSATAEDLPTASFAGQQDTYLNVIGTSAVLDHTRRCWASLFTDRAVTYRIQNGIDHRKVRMAVVVQKMVFPQAAGTLFTADPVTSNRKLLSIDASFGLGEAVVSGLVNPDVYKVRSDAIVGKRVAAKKLEIRASADGGTEESAIEFDRRERQVLTDDQVLELARLGRQIEEHFGRPQDVEWCLAGDAFHVVQARPITTLFPIPEANDRETHVYLSVGHQQMMTDPMRPLGLSLFQLTAFGRMFNAAGRLFVDVAQTLASPAGRQNLLDAMGQHDPLMKTALVSILERGDVVPALPGDTKEQGPGKRPRDATLAGFQAQVATDPNVVQELIGRGQASLQELERNIVDRSGTELFDFIAEDIQRLKKVVFDSRSFGVIMAAMDAMLWINENMALWLGDKNAADALSQSIPNNVTAEMGLELLDVADVLRPYPEVIEYLRHATGDDFLDGLVGIPGGQESRDAIYAYLGRYGMRCVGEIDITRTRWSEKPVALVPTILSDIRNFEPGAAKRKFDQGLREARAKEQELLDRLRQLPDGDQKAEKTRQVIGLLRDLTGYREYPKYVIASHYLIYKQALLREAGQLVQAGVIREQEEIYHLTFEELREVVRTRRLDRRLIREREDEHRLFEKLAPPRVITSDGEIVAGEYERKDLPAGALPGLAVSSGVIEGRARVISRIEDADLQDGDILVTGYTDPSWTPLFVTIKGLVTEVGGLMTHGAVIAREYGLPAVVGVENATRRIKDGQRIRVNAIDGYVELL